MAEPVDVGLVAGGPRAAVHAEAIGTVAEARLLAVCGQNQAEVKRLAKAGKAQAFASLGEMLGCDDIDLVVVASPWEHQAKHARAALQAGRHVWLDPPGVRSHAELRRLEAEAKKAGVRLAMAFTSRHHPNAQAVQNGIADGRIGPVAMARYELRRPWSKAGHALEAELAQAIDLVCWLAGRPPLRVFAAASPHIEHHLSAHLVLEDNAIGTIELHLAPPDKARAFPAREHLVVVGTKGTRRAGTSFKRKLALGSERPLAGTAEALRQMVRHIQGASPPPAPPGQAGIVFEAIRAAEGSAKSGQPMKLRVGGKS